MIFGLQIGVIGVGVDAESWFKVTRIAGKLIRFIWLETMLSLYVLISFWLIFDPLQFLFDIFDCLLKILLRVHMPYKSLEMLPDSCHAWFNPSRQTIFPSLSKKRWLFCLVQFVGVLRLQVISYSRLVILWALVPRMLFVLIRSFSIRHGLKINMMLIVQAHDYKLLTRCDFINECILFI